MFKTIGGPSATGGDVEGKFLIWADQWISSDALSSVVREFSGPEFSEDAPLSLKVAELLKFSSANWDFRMGKERNFARVQTFSEPVNLLVSDAATALGMRGQDSPKRTEYSHLLILGGLIRACLTRPRKARELCDEGVLFKSIAALTGYRMLAGDELDIVRQMNLGKVTNEIQALDVGVRRAFMVAKPSSRRGEVNQEEPFSSWEIAEYQIAGDIPLRLVVAPSTEPSTRRANTADTYKFWAETVVDLSPEDNVLLVTSSIYVPFQGTEAFRRLALNYGCGVETVGVDTGSEHFGILRQRFSTSNYLQEFNSAIQSISATLTSLQK
jgi:hypothetical protein